MDKKQLTETDICTKFITPALADRSWDIQTQILQEYYFTKGRVMVRGKTVSRGEGRKADYLLFHKQNLPLAVIEAKDNNHTVGAGMQQALEYAEALDVPFAYSTNGDAFLEHDRTGAGGTVEREIPLDQFPTPDELWSRYRAAKGLTEAAVESPGLQLYPSGCLFMVARSGILKRTFPVAINRVPATANQDLKVLRPFVPGLERYLQIMFRGLMRFILSDLVKTGMTVQSLKYDEFAQQAFPLPPLAEQQRIVAKVDELMALCDRLEAQQKDRDAKGAVLARAALARFAEAPTPANLEYLFHQSYTIDPADLRKSILTMAVRGKLVSQDESEASAEELLRAIKSELPSSERKRKRATVSPADAPFDLPFGWSWCRFPDLGVFGRGKSRNRPRNDPKLFVGGKYPLVQTGDVARSNGRIRSFTSLYNEVGLAQSKLWPAGTMCITIAANIADSGILDFEACIPDSVVGFIPAASVPSVSYFEYFVRTAKDHLERFAPSTAQKNINLGILEEVLIPLPPAAEQHRIVAKVDQLMALVDELEAQLAESRQQAERLMDAVVAELTSATTARSAS